MPGRVRGDSGQVGGIEAVPFGLLTFAVGGLLIANAWGVVDAKLGTDAAAREAVRAFVEADEQHAGTDAAVRTARRTMESLGRDPSRVQVAPVGEALLVRCARVTFEVSYDVPTLALPLIGGFGHGPFHVRSRHSEVVDPFRSDLAGQAEDCV